MEVPDFKRLISLDAMRGFTIAAMILVNFPGNGDFVFSPLQHSEWNGLTPTDVIAPFFLFMVGISIALAYSKRLQRGDSKNEMYRKIAIRSFNIFAVGMLLNLIPDFNFSELRYTGTLHRIAIVFFVCAMLFLNTSWKTQAFTGGSILVLYWLAMTFIPTPGFDKVMLEPGRNLAAWFDSKYLPGKMWQGTWDPEGILSTLPSIVSGITGMLAGKLIVSRLSEQEKVIRLMVAGFFAMLSGYLWSSHFPVNENIWTSSFVLVTSGMAALTIGAVFYLVDMKHYQKWTRAGIIFGANAITVYVLGDVLSLFFYRMKMGGTGINGHFQQFMTGLGVEPRLASMFYALIFVSICFLPALWLYRKNIFIKL
jgi:predicted acyltransferase